MLLIKNVSIYNQDELILKNASARLKGKVALVGANNSGKTRIIEALIGKRKIAAGQMELDDDFVKANNLTKGNNGIMYIPQSYPKFFQNIKVRYIVSFLTRAKFKNSSLLEKTKLMGELRYKDLSHIQKISLFIDIGRKNNKKIFLLDEPLVYLDMYERILFKEIIEKYLHEHLVVITTRNPKEDIIDFNQKLFLYERDLKKENPFPS